jgi:hypothetical protein
MMLSAASLFHNGAIGLTVAVIAIVLLCAAQAFALLGRFSPPRTVVSAAAVVALLITLVMVIGRFAALR